MADILVVVDMQNDFISGSLGTPEARAVVANVVRKVEKFSGPVLITLDTHGPGYLSTREGKSLPVEHCIRGTWGHALCDELLALDKIKGAEIYTKGTFGCVELARDLAARGDAASVELVGLCTDICVVSNALLVKAFLPDTPVRVDASCCAGVTPEKHAAALETMASCQIDISP